MRIAAVTMVHNEPEFLPLWLAHYGRELGRDNLYVVDHGSDDGSTAAVGPNLIRRPRGAFDEVARATFVARLQATLLTDYDAVIYADCDEFLVADPAASVGLADLVAHRCGDCLTAVGLDVLHRPGREAPIDLGRPILGQRALVRFRSDYCKTLVSRVPLRWSVGFHACDRVPRIEPDLVLFHLKYLDRDLCARIHARRRGVTWAPEMLAADVGWSWRLGFDAIEAAHFADPDERALPDDGFDFTDDLARVAGCSPFAPVSFAGAYARIPGRFAGAIAGLGADDEAADLRGTGP